MFGNDGIFGPYEFLGGYGLDVPYTKPSGQATVAKVEAKSDGQCGSYIGVQQMLADLGYNPGAIDGAAGKGTGNALAAFAASKGIPHSGYYPQKPLCEALIGAWSQRGAAAPAPAPSGGGMMSLLQAATPTAQQPGAARPMFLPKGAIMAMGPAQPRAGAGWWAQQTTTTKGLILVGALGALAGLLYFLKTRRGATPNARRSKRGRTELVERRAKRLRAQRRKTSLIHRVGYAPNYACRGTPPAKHRRKIRAKYGRKARRSDFAHPECYGYPVYDRAHARAAAGRFTTFGHKLPPKVRGKVKRRIQQAQRRYGGSP